MTPTSPPRAGMGRGLYPLIDADACQKRGLDVVEFARALIDAGPPLIQLRAKERAPADVQKWAEQIMSLLPQGGPELIVNDRADIAQAVGACGVHVGQKDLPASELIRHFPSLCVGLSTHNEAQLTAALELDGLGYVALGPIYPTDSKKDPEPVVTLENLQKAYELAQKCGRTLVAIGGITEARLPEVSRVSDLVAAISLVLPDVSEVRPYSWARGRAASLDRLIKASR
jgi:thiamine-phosphate pyrophosphorylase